MVNIKMSSTMEIIGFILFAVSEIIAVLPIPANGFLHSLSIGLNNSIKNSNTDIEMAQQIVTTKPNIASLFNKIAVNPELSSVIKKISDSPEIIPFIESLSKNPQLQYVLSLLQNNPDIIGDVKQLVETNITQNQIQRQIVQQQIIQQRQLFPTQTTMSTFTIEKQLNQVLEKLNNNQTVNQTVNQMEDIIISSP
jgi:hypothetical protein